MVPTCAVGLFSIASTEPSAMLKDAWDALANGDPNADEGLNLLIDGDNLDDAVENCLSTALFQSDLKMQRSLLAAAAYIMSLKDKVSLEKKKEFAEDKSPEN